MNDEGKRFHFDTRYWDAPLRYTAISLYQLGDLSCKGGFEVGEHIQPCFEISYIMSGKGTVMAADISYAVTQGDVFLSLPGQTHNLIADFEDPFRYCYLAFFFNESEDVKSPFYQVEQMLLAMKEPCIKDSQHIDIPFHAVLNELNAPRSLLQQMVEAYCVQVIVCAYRDFYGSISRLECKTDSYANEAVYSVISYIDNNLFEITALTQIARDLNYSYSHLGRIFAAELGMPLHSYYNKKRIEAAEAMLLEGALSINDIAIKLQYQSVHSFSKAFKKAKEMSPKQYQLFHKEKLI